jgi:hypothetical protein
MLTLANKLLMLASRPFTFVGYRTWVTGNGPKPWSLNNANTVVGGDQIKEGDLIFLYVARGDTGGHSCATPTDFTLLQSGIGNGTARDASGFLFYRIAPASLGSSISVSFGTVDTLAAQAGIMLVFRNFDPDTPIKQSLDATGTSGTLPNPPSVSTNALGRYIAFGAGARNGGFGELFTSTDLDPFYSIVATDDSDITVGAGWSDTVNNPVAFSGSGSSSAGWHAATVRIHALE